MNATDVDVSWDSSAPDIAEISSDGTITPKAKGSVTFSVKNNGVQKDTISLEVKKHVSSILISTQADTVYFDNKNFVLNAQVLPEDLNKFLKKQIKILMK